MPIKLKTAAKSTTAAVALETPEVMTDAELVDLVGSLSVEAEAITKQIKALGEKLKPYKEALAKLQEVADAIEMGDDDTDELRGNKYRLEIGKKGTSRSIIDLGKVFEFMGEEVFTEVATVPLKAIDDYLTPPQKKQVLKIERTNRSIKLVELPKD